MNKQREMIYSQRKGILMGEDVRKDKYTQEIIPDENGNPVSTRITETDVKQPWLEWVTVNKTDANGNPIPVGDGTYELETLPEICGMIDLVQAEPAIIVDMCDNIEVADCAGVYNGAYRVVELATR